MSHKKSKKATRSGRRGDPVSAYPLSADQLVRGIFQISKEDVKKVLASKPGKTGMSK
jgi:hypothetical protein